MWPFGMSGLVECFEISSSIMYIWKKSSLYVNIQADFVLDIQ